MYLTHAAIYTAEKYPQYYLELHTDRKYVSASYYAIGDGKYDGVVAYTSNW